MSNEEICNGDFDDVAKEAAGCFTGEAQVGNVAQNIINVIIAVLGIVAVIFVIVGAVQYITSQGDPGKMKKARDTIIYAILGVVLAGLAFAIVNFVLANLFNGS
ncbi:hypothetical protein IKG73_02555 [Candidatus Saccharibacteria bacterium]|nr:hypothetical protein [Candidatus Saccharibacteria bacterium]